MDPKRNDPSQNGSPGDGRRPKANIWLALIITAALVLLISAIYNSISSSQYTKTTYSQFLQSMENGELTEVELRYDRIIYLTKEEAAKNPAQQKAFFTGMPSGGDVMALANELTDSGVTVD